MQRRSAIAIAIALFVAGLLLAAGLTGSGQRARHPSAAAPAKSPTPAPSAPSPKPRPPFAVGLHVVRLVDNSRQISLPNGNAVPRMLVTYVRYPARGRASASEIIGAPAQRTAAPFPLIVFAHGFAVTPARYTELLRAWARAGYIVAAPVFPLENANAPGGPNESDLVNQPRDLSFVISELLQRGALHGLIDRRRIGVAGHSDGGETALAVAYDRSFRDRRVDAAAILSGAKIPGVGGFTFPPGSPPLLATQGTADTINPPSATHDFYGAPPPPKFLLTLVGASHLPPYTDDQQQLRIVERVTLGFFDRYLKQTIVPVHRLVELGTVPSLAAFSADP